MFVVDTNPLFNMWVSGDDRNSSRNILQVSDAMILVYVCHGC